MMYTVTDLQRSTGFSDDQVRDRLRMLRTIMGDGVRRGPRSKLLVSDGVLASLRRMRELESSGLGPKEAIREVMRELGNGSGNGEAKDTHIEPSSGEVETLRAYIAHLEAEVTFLRERVADLMPLALPRPRPWWLWWRR